MRLKVCGMRDPKNIEDLLTLSPDFVGMIFYERSPRFVKTNLNVKWSKDVKRVGVFVNPDFNEVMNRVKDYKLDIVQLHGGESIDFVKQLKKEGITIIKVFSVMDELPVEKMQPYEAFVDYFMFDTKSPVYGGSGKKFDWNILSSYDFDKPFFLSGGIDLEDIESIKSLALKKLEVIDINSRFEIAPAMKDIQKIKEFKEAL